MRRQSNPITPHETWLELFWSKLSCLLFMGCITTVFNYKAECKCANAFYQGRDHVWVKESELQRCYQQRVIECGKDVLFVFVFSYFDSSRRHTRQDANSSRQEKIWARLVGKSRPGVTVICVSPWYVYPRTHIPSDMCIPPIWLPVKCVSPTPHPSKQVSVLFLLFLWILRIIVKGTTNDSRLRATQSTKEQRFETK